MWASTTTWSSHSVLFADDITCIINKAQLGLFFLFRWNTLLSSKLARPYASETSLSSSSARFWAQKREKQSSPSCFYSPSAAALHIRARRTCEPTHRPRTAPPRSRHPHSEQRARRRFRGARRAAAPPKHPAAVVQEASPPRLASPRRRARQNAVGRLPGAAQLSAPSELSGAPQPCPAPRQTYPWPAASGRRGDPSTRGGGGGAEEGAAPRPAPHLPPPPRENGNAHARRRLHWSRVTCSHAARA